MPPQTIVLFLGGIAAGVLGSIFGLGAGIVIVPLLVLVVKVPIHYAIATSLMCVIAASSVRRGTVISPIDIATVAASIAGSVIAGYLRATVLEMLFVVVLLVLAIAMAFGDGVPHAVAGIASGLFGLGIIGVTAAAGAFIYYGRGQVQPEITAATLLGVISGSRAGLLFAERARSSMILRLSVALSCCLFLVGLLAAAVDPIAFGTIKPAHIPLLPRALIHGSPAAMMHIGVLIVLLTPVARVGATAWTSARQRNSTVAPISIGVLLLLVVSFTIGAIA